MDLVARITTTWSLYRSTRVFVGLNVLDATPTLVGVSMGAYEVFPLARYLLEQSGWLFALFKGVAPLLVALAIVKCSRRYPQQARRVLAVSIVAMAIICLFNAVVLLLIIGFGL